MEKDVLNYVIEKTQELISAPTCSAETKAAGAKYCDCPACLAVAAILVKKDALCKIITTGHVEVIK